MRQTMALVRGALTGRCLLVSGSPCSGKSTLVAHALDKIGSCFVKAEGKLWRYEGPGDFVCHSLCLDTYWKREAIQYEEALEDVKQVRKKTPSAVIFMDGHQAIGSKILRDEADLCIWIEATWEIRLARSKFKVRDLEKHKDSWERHTAFCRQNVDAINAAVCIPAGSGVEAACRILLEAALAVDKKQKNRQIKKEQKKKKDGKKAPGKNVSRLQTLKHIFCHASWLSSLLGGTGKGKRH